MTGILAVGDLCLDLRVLAREAAPAGGDVPARMERRPGGSAAACAAFARRLGAGPVRFVGRVGDDPDGDYLLAELAAAGVEARVRRVPGTRTARVVSVVAGGERTMYTDPGVLETLAADDVEAIDMEGMGFLHVSGYTLTRPGGEAAMARWMRLARALGLGVSLDPGPAAPAEIASVMGQVTLLVAEAREQRRLGPSAPRAPVTVVTAGPGPVRLILEGREHRFSPPPLRLSDPTGAGDALRGALLARLAQGAPPAAALEQALRDLPALVVDGRFSWGAGAPPTGTGAAGAK